MDMAGDLKVSGSFKENMRMSQKVTSEQDPSSGTRDGGKALSCGQQICQQSVVSLKFKPASQDCTMAVPPREDTMGKETPDLTAVQSSWHLCHSTSEGGVA